MIDRLSRRLILLTADIVQGVAVGAIALLSMTGNLELWHLAVLAFIFGGAQGFYMPAFTSLVPEIVATEHLAQANSLTAASRLFGSSFVGPLVGGILVASVGASWAFAIDTASFVISIMALAAMRRTPRGEATGTSIVAEAKDGFRYVRHERWLWIALLAAGLINFIFSGCAEVVAPLYIDRVLHAGATGLGMYFAALGLGGGLGVVLAGLTGMPRRRVTWMYLAWAGAGACFAGIGLSPNIYGVVSATLLIGALLEYGNVIWPTLLQDTVPRNMLGRVSAIDWFMSLGLQPISLAVAVPVATTVGVGATLVVGSVLAATGALIGMTRRGARDPELSPRSPSEAP